MLYLRSRPDHLQYQEILLCQHHSSEYPYHLYRLCYLIHHYLHYRW